MACAARGNIGECQRTYVYYNGQQKSVCMFCGRDM